MRCSTCLGAWRPTDSGPAGCCRSRCWHGPAFCGLTAAAGSLGALLVTRTLFGAAEGPFGATTSKALNQWFPKRDLLNAVAFVGSSTPLGAVAAGPLLAVLLTWCGWRWSLVAVACLGICFTIAWMVFTRGLVPPSQPSPTVQPTPSDSRDADEDAAPRSLLYYAGSPVVIANALAYFAYTWVLSLYLSWLPTFLVTKYHLDLRAAAFGSSAPWILGFVGVWAGALLAGRIFRVTGRLLFSRTIVQVVGLLAAAVGTVLVGQVSSAWGAVGVAALALFALYLSGATFWAVVQDVVPGRLVGSVSGYTHLVANIGGILSPILTGAIVQRTDSFNAAWLLAAGVSAFAGLAVLGASRSRQAAVASARLTPAPR